MKEHTCAGFYDLTCEACQELRDRVWEELDEEDTDESKEEVDDLYEELGGEG